MSILMKMAVGIGAVFLFIGSMCVTIAALYPPKKHLRVEGETDESGIWDESIEDV